MPLGGFSRYELQERIGIGGMAEVFRARAFDASGQAREVVVKKILPHHNDEADFRTMFMDEARIAANLDHPNVVAVLDLGRLDGDLFLAMEYIEGTDLLRLSEWMEGAGRKMPIATALYLGAEILKGLHHAHTRADAMGRPLGIVHRDVTPQNVMVSAQGAVKLTDFGIARAANRLSHTMVGTIKGNLLYSSPEQISGTPVDARADVYSAGILLYRLLAGCHPFDGDDLPKIYQRALSGDIPPVSSMNRSVPTNLDRIVARATALVPDQRFASADELRRALEEFLAGKQLTVDLKMLCSDVRAMKSGLRAAKPDGRVLVPEGEVAVLPTSVGGSALPAEDTPVPRLANLPVRQPPPVVEEEKTQTMPLPIPEKTLAVPGPPPLPGDEEDKTSRTIRVPRVEPSEESPARVASTILLPASQAALSSAPVSALSVPADDAARTLVMGLPPLSEATPLSRAVAEVLEEPSGVTTRPPSPPDVSSSLSPAVLAALTEGAWPEAPPSLPDRTVEVTLAPPAPVVEPAPAPIAAEPPTPIVSAPSTPPRRTLSPAPAPPELSEIPPPIVSAPSTPPRRTLSPTPAPPWELPRTPAGTPAAGRPRPTPPPVMSPDLWSSAPVEAAVPPSMGQMVELEEEPPPAVIGTIVSERSVPAPAPVLRPTQTPPPWLANSRSAPLLSTEWPSSPPSTPSPTPSPAPAPVAAEPVAPAPSIPNLAPPAAAPTPTPAPVPTPATPVAAAEDFSSPFDDVVEAERTTASAVDAAFAEKVGLKSGISPGASLEGHTDVVVAVAALRTGRYVVSASHDHMLRVWDLTTRTTQAILKGHTGAVTCVALGKDGSRVLSGGIDQTVRLWNTESGQPVATMKGHVEGILACAVSPDGRTALSGGQDRSVRLWDLSTGREQLVMQGHEQAVASLSYVGDGSIAVSASFDGLIQMWNLLDGSMLAMFPTGVTGLRAVAVARDGRRLVFGGGDGQIHVWNAEQGTPLLTFPGHRRGLLSVALSPDETQLATASEDGTARIWELATGKPLGTYETGSGALHSVAFALEGHTLVGASVRRVCVWDLAP